MVAVCCAPNSVKVNVVFWKSYFLLLDQKLKAVLGCCSFRLRTCIGFWGQLAEVFWRLLKAGSQSRPTYNVTRRVRATADTVENGQVLRNPRERVRMLRDLACNAHRPYCHLLPARLYNIYQHYLKKGKIFEKNVLLNVKCVFDFLYNFCRKLYPFQEEFSEMLSIKMLVFM